jgi:hypothetical protein
MHISVSGLVKNTCGMRFSKDRRKCDLHTLNSSRKHQNLRRKNILSIQCFSLYQFNKLTNANILLSKVIIIIRSIHLKYISVLTGFCDRQLAQGSSHWDEAWLCGTHRKVETISE